MRENNYNLPKISVVIPIKNESENLIELLDELLPILSKLDSFAEIIIVDDNSNDDSFQVVKSYSFEIKGSMLSVVPIRLDKQVGKDFALIEGFKVSKGDLIITMDGDLQNCPSDIPKMMNLLKDNDMICGVRNNRKDHLLRLICSKVSNVFRNWLVSDDISDAGCALRIMRKKCIGYLIHYSKPFKGYAHFFYPAIIKAKGFNCTEMIVSHRKRKYGTTKFPFIYTRIISGLHACLTMRAILRNTNTPASKILLIVFIVNNF